MNRIALSALITAAAIGITACSTESQTRPETTDQPLQGQPLFAKGTVVSTQATIVRVNQKDRVVTLEVPNKPGDNFVDVSVGDNVKNLDQIRFGDRVTVKYVEAVFVQLLRHGKAEPGIDVAAAPARAEPGQRPAGAVAKKVSVIAVVEAVDKEDKLVTLRGPKGNTKMVEVGNPEILDKLRVGSKVKTTFARAFAVSITPSPVR
jgi:hypothetical protein